MKLETRNTAAKRIELVNEIASNLEAAKVIETIDHTLVQWDGRLYHQDDYLEIAESITGLALAGEYDDGDLDWREEVTEALAGYEVEAAA